MQVFLSSSTQYYLLPLWPLCCLNKHLIHIFLWSAYHLTFCHIYLAHISFQSFIWQWPFQISARSCTLALGKIQTLAPCQAWGTQAYVACDPQSYSGCWHWAPHLPYWHCLLTSAVFFGTHSIPCPVTGNWDSHLLQLETPQSRGALPLRRSDSSCWHQIRSCQSFAVAGTLGSKSVGPIETFPKAMAFPTTDAETLIHSCCWHHRPGGTYTPSLTPVAGDHADLASRWHLLLTAHTYTWDTERDYIDS